MVETDFFTALSTASTVTAICGTRIYPCQLPKDPTLPAVEYRFIAGSNLPAFTTMGAQKYRVEVSCWGDTYLDAISLRYAVVKALSGYHAGTMSISYLMPRDNFDDILLQYEAVCEFYVLDTLQ